MRVEIVTSSAAAWDAFVEGHPDSRLCHTWAWGSMIRRAFRHEVFRLAAYEDQVLRGVLPLTLVRSRLFGTHMVSQAFSNYGGPLVHDQKALPALLDGAYGLAQKCGGRQIEFRGTSVLAGEHHQRMDKVCMHLPLDRDPDVVWRGFRPEIRNRVRKAGKAGLTALGGGVELLRDFYDLWTIRMRQLGTPCYPRKFFRRLLEQFPGLVRIVLVRQGRSAIAAGVFYAFNGLAQCRWAATLTEANALSPNMLLYWTAIEYYCRAGVSTFDFGRSTQGGPQFEFKRRWGAQPVQLYYEHWSVPGHRLEMITPSSPRYHRKVELWKKMPLWATRVMGPMISPALA